VTRKTLALRVISVITLYLVVILVAVLLRLPMSASASSTYSLYKDVMPLLIAIPAAYLAYAFQRRNAYMQALRAVWGPLTESISAALMFADSSKPSLEQQSEVLRKLSRSIEEVRALYKNVPAASNQKGWYPFEPLKQIYQLLREVDPSKARMENERKHTVDSCYTMWRESREQFLVEFDREVPTYHHAEYSQLGPIRGSSAPQ